MNAVWCECWVASEPFFLTTHREGEMYMLDANVLVHAQVLEDGVEKATTNSGIVKVAATGMY